MIDIDWNLFLRAFLVFSILASITFVVVGYWAWRSLRRINLPEHLSFVEALRLTPLPIVILLDLLDLVFDIFAAPITWVLLGKIGLTPLRAVTVAEAVVPGTQLIPTMTLAWLGVRVLGIRVDHIPTVTSSVVKRSPPLESHPYQPSPNLKLTPPA